MDNRVAHNGSPVAAVLERPPLSASIGGELLILADASAVRGPELEGVDSAILLFGEAGSGPLARALVWLRYRQRATSVQTGPLSRRSCAASAHLAAWCRRVDEFREVAAAFGVVVLGAEQRHQWRQANDARLAWASCLHRCGYCDEAELVLRQVWDLRSAGRPRGSLASGTACLRMMRMCGRRDEAAALWASVDGVSTPAEKGLALDQFLRGASEVFREAEAAGRGTVCAYRDQTAQPWIPVQRARPVIPALGVGGCGHG
jgi:hypothetical protein